MILIIDHYDSFVENLARMAREIAPQHTTKVLCQDTPLEAIVPLAPRALILSPGPGSADNTGISAALLAHYQQTIPILGVCLGHQLICQAFGGKCGRTPTPKHGKTSAICHNGHALFNHIAPRFEAGLYHSLAAQKIPPAFEVIAKTTQDAIMAIAHKDLPIYGVQFHPESILTPDGTQIMRNFLTLLE